MRDKKTSNLRQVYQQVAQARKKAREERIARLKLMRAQRDGRSLTLRNSAKPREQERTSNSSERHKVPQGWLLALLNN